MAGSDQRGDLAGDESFTFRKIGFLLLLIPPSRRCVIGTRLPSNFTC